MAGRFELKENAPVRVPGTQVGYPQIPQPFLSPRKNSSDWRGSIPFIPIKIPLDMASDGLCNGTVSFSSVSMAYADCTMHPPAYNKMALFVRFCLH